MRLRLRTQPKVLPTTKDSKTLHICAPKKTRQNGRPKLWESWISYLKKSKMTCWRRDSFLLNTIGSHKVASKQRKRFGFESINCLTSADRSWPSRKSQTYLLKSLRLTDCLYTTTSFNWMTRKKATSIFTWSTAGFNLSSLNTFQASNSTDLLSLRRLIELFLSRLKVSLKTPLKILSFCLSSSSEIVNSISIS